MNDKIPSDPKYNIVCIVGFTFSLVCLVFTALFSILAFRSFLHIVETLIFLSFAPLVLSIVGVVMCKKKKQKGFVFGLLGIIISVITIVANILVSASVLTVFLFEILPLDPPAAT